MRGVQRQRVPWQRVLPFLTLLASVAAVPAPADAQCIDEAIRDELNARRRYRGVQERIFQKALRHELSVMGGFYAADLTSSHWQVQGAYTFHLSEALGLELRFAYTRTESDIVRIIEDEIGAPILQVDRDVFIYTGHLLYSLAYGKMRWFGGPIGRFDLYLAAGGGVTDNQTARGLTFSGGLGLKLYWGSGFAFRGDFRDQLLQQELLGESVLVNNLVGTLGISVFLPFRP